MEPVTVVILILMGVFLGIPLFLSLIVSLIFSILKSTNQTIGGLGRALTIPALLAMLFRFQLSKENAPPKERNDHE